jgi:hypothetical protein
MMRDITNVQELHFDFSNNDFNTHYSNFYHIGKHWLSHFGTIQKLSITFEQQQKHIETDSPAIFAEWRLHGDKPDPRRIIDHHILNILQKVDLRLGVTGGVVFELDEERPWTWAWKAVPGKFLTWNTEAKA